MSELDILKVKTNKEQLIRQSQGGNHHYQCVKEQ